MFNGTCEESEDNSVVFEDGDERGGRVSEETDVSGEGDFGSVECGRDESLDSGEVGFPFDAVD